MHKMWEVSKLSGFAGLPIAKYSCGCIVKKQSLNPCKKHYKELIDDIEKDLKKK